MEDGLSSCLSPEIAGPSKLKEHSGIVQGEALAKEEVLTQGEGGEIFY